MDYNLLQAQLLHACKLAQDLERNINANVLTNPELLLHACEEVEGAFREPVHRLRSAVMNPDLLSDQPMDLYDLLGGGRESHDQGRFQFFGLQRAMRPLHGLSQLAVAELGGSSAGYENFPVGITGGGVGGIEVQSAAEGSSSGARPEGSTFQRSSRRREWAVTKLVPAPRVGNLDLLPDDGYTWRKYGQKDILKSRFPRSYYRCTHKNYGCRAKKYVQRRDDDPFTLEITYQVDHTCQTSLTPLLIPTLALSSSNSGDGSGGGGGGGDGSDDPTRGSTTSYNNLDFLPETTQPLEVLLSTSIQLNNSWRPELLASQPMQTLIMTSTPSGEGTSRQAEEGHGSRDHVDHFPVADLADVMFNSGSSGINMDGIFSSKRNHKD